MSGPVGSIDSGNSYGPGTKDKYKNSSTSSSSSTSSTSSSVSKSNTDADVTEDYDNDSSSYSALLSQYLSGLKDYEDKTNTAINNYQTNYTNALNDYKTNQASTIAQNQTAYQSKVSEYQAAQKQALADSEATYKAALSDYKTSQSEALAKAQATYKAALSDYKTSQSEALAKAQQVYQSELSNYKTEQEALLAEKSEQQQKAIQAGVDKSVNSYESQKQKVAENYADLYRQLYLNNMNSQKNINQQMAAAGQTGGLSESTLLGLNTNYQDNLRQGKTSEQSELNELEQAIIDARLSGDIETANALAEIASEKAQVYSTASQNYLNYLQNNQNLEYSTNENAYSNYLNNLQNNQNLEYSTNETAYNNYLNNLQNNQNLAYSTNETAYNNILNNLQNNANYQLDTNNTALNAYLNAYGNILSAQTGTTGNVLSNYSNYLTNAASTAASQASENKSYAYNMAMAMLQSGTMPSDALLSSAGISTTDAQAIVANYADQKATSGSSSGSGSGAVDTVTKPTAAEKTVAANRIKSGSYSQADVETIMAYTGLTNEAQVRAYLGLSGTKGSSLGAGTGNEWSSGNTSTAYDTVRSTVQQKIADGEQADTIRNDIEAAYSDQIITNTQKNYLLNLVK